MMALAGMKWCAPLVLALGMALPAAAAPVGEVMPTPEAVQLLNRMARAPQDVSYQGVYIHQFPDHMEAVRVVHVRDGSFDAERRESLDGSAREYLRLGDQVSLYMPDGAPNVLDRHHANKLFPRQLPDQPEQLLAGYQIRLVGRERVAGFDTDIYDLEPKDKLRFLHRFWVHPDTGLTLKAAMFGTKRELIDLQVFSQLQMGAVNRRLLKPSHPLKPVPVEANPVNTVFADRQLEIRVAPQGFQLLRQIQRPMPGHDKPVTHQLYGDGLVTVSVFLEPFDSKVALGPSDQGMVNLYTRQVGPYLVTVLGEVPPETAFAFATLYQWRAR
ncbi:sigma E regulatory protein, MucB/RseB [Andreprevotia lacus DSM 23236]|jgi:sigma-E factor negative regulatory protein RseB|uniref:Sigma E regulatory protein, MucB/RseB n=1 Tax=Andreprevotia lacus DSM 23236 TaxID=1121001 RepID=A0A1W1XN55_9NEIS|nr:MucB/RseB C-terminal domain-containing protein [Andreprevotia lacus]SMC25277.1 sigma E regulatory protein, MucB/RseB [Andreprevotia lacus DSM 23236]